MNKQYKGAAYYKMLSRLSTNKRK